jgi:P27 family predicted phage terminase small subunit
MPGKPKPTKLKILQGTARPDRIKDNEWQPDEGVLECPSWLCEYGRAEWQHYYPLLEGGPLTLADRGCLAELCQHLADARRYREQLATIRQTDPLGDLVRLGSGGTGPNPLATMARQASDAARKYMVELGLTPSARTRVTVPNKPKAGNDKARFFGDH